MVRGRGGHDGGGGRQNNFGGSNRYFDRTENMNAGDRASGNHRGRGSGEHRRGIRGGNRGSRGRGNRGGYNHYQDQSHENGNYERNRFSRDLSNQDEEVSGFKKFTDPTTTPRRNSMAQHHSFGPHSYNGSKSWFRDNQGDYINREEGSTSSANKLQTPEQTSTPVPAAVQPKVGLSEPLESKEPKLLRNIKKEKIQSDTPSSKIKNKKVQPVAPSESSSSSESSSEEEETPSVKTKSKDKAKPVPNVRIKKEIIEKKKIVKEALPAAAPPPPPTESSSECSSSGSSSGEEYEVPEKPQLIKSAEATKTKKERASEEDVVCLGKMNNVENLVEDDEGTESQPCVVCSKLGHSGVECQTKCKKCSHSSYECHVVCKNCGEAYGQNIKNIPKQMPNPFVMFMQFMQFCMSQHYDASAEIKYPFPQFESASAPVLGPTQTVEVTRKDITNSKRDRKRTKSDTKQSRKMHSETDSESSSKATTSTKKRKKRAKLAAREAQTLQSAQQQQQQQIPSFGGQFPANMPFPAGFNAHGYNPMLAFTQMMGYNPAAMNFTR